MRILAVIIAGLSTLGLIVGTVSVLFGKKEDRR